MAQSSTASDSFYDTAESNKIAFNKLCCSDNILPNKNSSIAINHHQYDKLFKSWIKKSSDPQQFINLTISTTNEDYSSFGFEHAASPRSANFNAMESFSM